MSPSSNGKGPLISFANSLWIDKLFLLKRPYQEIASSAHGAQVKNVDFLQKVSQAVAEINSWVESVTNGLIKNIICDLSNGTILVVANALYFKGSWSREFEKRLTRDRIFYLLNRRTIRIPFMTQFGRHSFRAFKEFKVLKLPYSNGQENKYFDDGQENKNFSMYFILPHEKDGLKDLIENISSDVSFFGQDFMLEKVELDDFAIPKFTRFLFTLVLPQ